MKAYFKSILLHRVSRRFSQNVALHLHARQLGPKSADFHLLSVDGRFAVRSRELALPMSLDPVEQRLIDHTQRARCRRDALAVVHQPNCLLLEFERVARP